MHEIRLDIKTHKSIIEFYHKEVTIYSDDYAYIIVSSEKALDVYPISVAVESVNKCDEGIIIETSVCIKPCNDKYRFVAKGILTSIFLVKTLLAFEKARKITDEEKMSYLSKCQLVGPARKVFEIYNSIDFGYDEIVMNPNVVYEIPPLCNLVEVGFLLGIDDKYAIPLFSYRNGMSVFLYEGKSVEEFINDNEKEYLFEIIKEEH